MMLRDITTGLRSSAIAIAALRRHGGSGFAAQEQPQKKLPAEQRITFGYLLPDPATQSYPSVLARLLGEGYEIGNFGHSGTTLLRHGHRPMWIKRCMALT